MACGWHAEARRMALSEVEGLSDKILCYHG